jgi:hypothetical protein
VNDDFSSNKGEIANRPTDEVMLSAIDREQDLHRVAAARQLATLERIEEGRRYDDDDGEDDTEIPIIDESYIPIVGTTTLTR